MSLERHRFNGGQRLAFPACSAYSFLMREFETMLIRLAVTVLDAAATRGFVERADGAEVRLALRVLVAYLPRRAQLDGFWREVSENSGTSWYNGRLALTWIVDVLEREGWEVTPGTMPCQGWPMCNRYRMTAKEREMAARYGVQSPYPEDVTVPPPELFPKRPAWVVCARGAGASRRREPSVMDWGWPRTIPGKRGAPIETVVTNVRNLDSPMWRSALADPKRRCLVPVTAFSEYGDGPKGKKPLYWFDVPSRPIFSFAGVWRPTAMDIPVFAFLTCEPNAVVAPIHPKAMPVILHEEDEERWLMGKLGDLVAPFPSQLMKVERVGAADGQDPCDEEQTS